MEDMFRAFYQNLPSFYQNLPSLNVGAGVPVIGVAETKDAIEVNAELRGVDEKDIKVSLDGNRLVISGEKKAETKKDEKDWHVEERSYGSFYRSLSLPFKPEDGAIEAQSPTRNSTPNEIRRLTRGQAAPSAARSKKKLQKAGGFLLGFRFARHFRKAAQPFDWIRT
jgi:HSP20 family molecular chaperone IbpA